MAETTAKVAVFWDKSFLWGLIAYRTFRQLGIDFSLLGAGDIRSGGLSGFDLVFVPGGWASDKIKKLGPEGAAAIRDYVGAGGGYLGFCGGAGLALSHDSGLGLAPFGRLPSDVRLPSFSGKIALRQKAPGHPMWKGMEDGTAFYAWWPGQFALRDADGSRILATYGPPEPGSFVTDLPIGPEHDWDKWEKLYGINLDPGRIIGQPAVIEVPYGRGRAILSYLHFETPEDDAGHQVLLNLLEYMVGKPAMLTEDAGTAVEMESGPAKTAVKTGVPAETGVPAGAGASSEVRPANTNVVAGHAGLAQMAARDMMRQASDFIAFGQTNFLWFWRNQWLLHWRRGVKGIEYSALYGMLAELKRLVEKYEASLGEETAGKIAALQRTASSFFDDARQLIMRERFAMSQGPISPLKSGDEQINELRQKLFSSSKRCGGIYEEMLDLADTILLPLLVRELREMKRGE